MAYNWKVDVERNTRTVHYDASVNSRDKITLDATMNKINGWSNFEYNVALTTPYRVGRILLIIKHL